MKKNFGFIILVFFFLCFQNSAFAQIYKGQIYKGQMAPCPVPNKLKDELYVGIGTGYDAYRIRQSFAVTDSLGVSRSGNPILSANGWEGNLFAGYGRYFGWFYIAGELVANYTTAQTSFSFGAYNTDISLRTSMSASILRALN